MARRIHGGVVGSSSVGPIQVSSTATMSPPPNQDMVIDLQGASRFVVNGTATELVAETVQTNSYTIALTDQNRVVSMNNTSAATVTVPAEEAVNFPIGSVVFIARIGTGEVTLAAGAGVSLTKTGALYPFEELYVRKRGTNDWITVDGMRLTGSGGNTVNFTTAGYTTHLFTSTGGSTFTVN